MAKENKSSTLAEFDYVIVGAGSAGCVLANRFSADGRYSVCILEAGGSDRKFWIQTPLGYSKTFADEKLNWMYTTQPSEELNGRRSYWPRGKVLGGSSSINAMVYIRGQPEDYNEWAAQGNHGWGWNDVLPYFKKSEQCSNGANEYRGGSGPLYVQDVSRHYHPIRRRFLAAAQELGLAEIDDFNAAQVEGVGSYQIAVKGGRRMSAARAYLRPALQRRNLTLFKNALASKLLFDGRRARGVEFNRKGVLHTVNARCELIVAAGTINSPQLLQLSGVGAASELSGLGIKPVLDNPNVGQHLQDHLAISHFYHATEPTLNNQLRPWWGKLFAGVQYLALRSGPLAIGVNQAGGFIRSSTERTRPNLQLYFSPLTYSTNSSHGERPIQPDAYPGFLNSISQCRPLSRGHITIRSSGPHAAPLISPNYLAIEEDRLEMLEGVRFLRAMAQTKALSGLIRKETIPGSDVAEDEQLLADIYARSDTVYHPTSTCKMGPDLRTAVVDNRLSVHGLQNLRVVDASVFPSVTSGNINAPVIMLAEKAADMILAAAPSRD